MKLFSMACCVLAMLHIMSCAAVPRVFAQPNAIVPSPRLLTPGVGSFHIKRNARILATSQELAPLAAILSDETTAITSIRLKPIVSSNVVKGDIVLQISGSLHSEQYEINVTPNAIQVSGGSYLAVGSATAALLQMLPGSGTTIAAVHVEDEPQYSFRGALLDLARKYHTAASIEQIVELCRFYRIRYLHLHITDDQLFMFPSSRHPELGRSNREFARFEPGSNTPMQPYTSQELRSLDRYSAERGVYLVPEIDLPGHSGRLIADAPSIFGVPGNDSTVNIASEETVSELKALLNEVMDTFASSPFVHLGADEVGLSGIDQTAQYPARVKSGEVSSVHELYERFVVQMHDTIAARGKRAIVWEEAANTAGRYALPKDTIVMEWNHSHDPANLAALGYDIVNASWTPLYIVRNNKKTPEYISRWSVNQFGQEGSTDYQTVKPGPHLLGAQLCSWEDSECIEIPSLRSRLPVVAEKLWRGQHASSFAVITRRLAQTDHNLNALILPITITAEGSFKDDENSFTTPLTITLKPIHSAAGLHARYTLDNSLPSAAWLDYKGPFRLETTAHLRAGLFDSAGKQVGYLSGAWYLARIPTKPNLATGKPVTVGPGPDRTDSWASKFAVDGILDNPDSHWASTDAAPQWLTVDLGRTETINHIRLITYWDNSRYYQWNAEISTDGKSWRKALDFAANTKPATSIGYEGSFAETRARYVRINMLKNSANPYVHIVELIVERVRETTK